MTPVLMTHPKHGATHAYDLAEIDRLKGYGWETPAEVASEAAPEAKRKPGRPKAK